MFSLFLCLSSNSNPVGVTINKTCFREAPNKDSTLICTLDNNTRVEILKASDLWWKITAAKKTGYVIGKAIKTTGFTKEKVQLKKKADDDSDNILTIRSNEKVYVIDRPKEEWLTIQYEDKKGFCESDSIRIFEEKYDEIQVSKKQMESMGWKNYSYKDLNYCLNKYKIVTNKRKLNFLAMCAYLSDWSQYPLESTSGKQYEYSKELGNKNKDDGGLFKGAGYIRLIGRYNYQNFSVAVNDKNVQKYGARYVADYFSWSASGFIWNKLNLNDLCDDGGSVTQFASRLGINNLKGNREELDKIRGIYNKVRKNLNIKAKND